MKMLMAIIDGRRKEELEILLRREGVAGFTEIPDVHGFGSSGERMDSAVHPGTSAVVLVLLEAARLEGVTAALREYCAECSEHIRLLHWDVSVEI